MQCLSFSLLFQKSSVRNEADNNISHAARLIECYHGSFWSLTGPREFSALPPLPLAHFAHSPLPHFRFVSSRPVPSRPVPFRSVPFRSVPFHSWWLADTSILGRRVSPPPPLLFAGPPILGPAAPCQTTIINRRLVYVAPPSFLPFYTWCVYTSLPTYANKGSQLRPISSHLSLSLSLP